MFYYMAAEGSTSCNKIPPSTPKVETDAIASAACCGVVYSSSPRKLESIIIKLCDRFGMIYRDALLQAAYMSIRNNIS